MTRRTKHTDADLQGWIDHGELDRARRVIEERLAKNPNDPTALFYRGACFMQEGLVPWALEDFKLAAELKDNDSRFLNACATVALLQDRPRDAVVWAQKALKEQPNHIPALVTQCVALARLKRWPEALPLAQRLYVLDDSSTAIRQLLAEALRGCGRLIEALDHFNVLYALDNKSPSLELDIALCNFHAGDRLLARELIEPLLKREPESPDFHVDLGIRAQNCAAPLIALEFFKRGHELFPDDLGVLVNLGITVQAFGNPAEALFYFQKAIALDERCEAAWYYAAVSHHALQNRSRAEEYLEKCIEIDPRHSSALLMLATLRKDAGRLNDAKQLLRDAIASDPGSLQAYLNLSHFLQEAGELDEAGEVLDAARDAELDEQALRQPRASLLLKRGDITSANEIFRQILLSEPENPDAMSGLLFCSNYDPELTPEQIAEAYKSWDRRFVRWRAPSADFKFANKLDSKRRIKLGYIGGDFKNHSVAFFSEPLLAHHDHEQFEVYCYANQKALDATTQRLMGMADHWRWTQDLSDEALVEMIRMDGIDILIDLSNHTAFHRLYLMGRKPAPIQMTTLGMPTTTGLSAIDWRITDAFMDPPGLTEHLHSEKLLRIVSGWCYKTSDEAKDLLVAELPALKNGHITFASFNAFGKINPKVIKLWGKLLKSIPDAELVLATGGKADDKVLNDRIKKTCRSCGVPLKRVRLMPRKPMKEYFQEHDKVDIVLDAFPYTGATVTAHALWMGVPVITLSGPSPIHRSATSMMSTIGHPEFVAQTQDEYLEIAQRWAADIPALAALRAGLRAQVQASPLMDGATVTRDLEKKLRQVWRDWCKTQKTQRKALSKSKE